VEPYLGLLLIEWTGDLTGDATGEAADLHRVDVHLSPDPGFTPHASTLIATLPPHGGVVYATSPRPHGVPVHVKLVAYDCWGNASPASAEASGATRELLTL
jgi:hypothetical protein